MDDKALQDRLSGALLRLRARQPFFAALALFAGSALSDAVPTAATDGRRIFWNREFLAGLKSDEVDGVLLHEVLHAALLHVTRRGTRDPLLWNIAADIVVNGMVEAAKLKLPAGAVREKKWEKLAVEEVYELLEKSATTLLLGEGWRDLLPPGVGEAEALAAHWRAANAQARALMMSTGQGTMPAGWDRELGALEPAQLDWRSYLWRHLVRTPTDFSGFDRRLIHQGLYLETLEGESVRVCVCIDTSGSIGPKQLSQFLGEVVGILRSYPHLVCNLSYADAALYGPYPLTGDTPISELPAPKGGGGTDFRPFFAAVAEAEQNGDSAAVCVYLTDGFGAFPERPSEGPTLWVVNAGGLGAEEFPFGEVARLLLDT
ncbi:vWA domain-containing protein [Armatimonas rosea]|uniref:Putative metal-dependent peptidase n=1 Tax=Armatimonas rosea TaxID=685828 RepID=A0A7W9ST31_ARMRO|nr:VWA-like domain-containing protein [Armatimonas rosea]MBB6052346.1 putative metal-dependent peptidase [Armatimonas rosea]